MIDIKNVNEIDSMKIGGAMLGKALNDAIAAVKPGIKEIELDRIAEKSIREQGGEPGFMRVPGYKHTICAATNEVVVHGIPSERVLKKGDVICIDCGVFYQGFHTDMADTVIVGGPDEAPPEVRKFLSIGEKALWAGIDQARKGNRVGHISKVIQDIVEGEGYYIIRSLVGHGVGRELHEAPEVPGFLSGKIEKTPELIPGMTIAVEVIYAMGTSEVAYANNDGWSIKSADDSLTAVFERSIVITDGDPIVLTK
ncbi:MAG: methionyl aminopeptidase [Patescibacteria group bacterium]|jgi:methionyl aminopeptidase|nr:methionyl aminopeptidase [Patescibacteria group bacterium]